MRSPGRDVRGRPGGGSGRLRSAVLLLAVVLTGCGGGAGAAGPAAPPAPGSPPSASGTARPGPGAGSSPATSSPATSSPPVSSSGAPGPTGPRPLPAREAVEVTSLQIPAIGLRTGEPEALGRLPDGSLAAPEDPDRTGWYADGPVPGERGPAVLAGHVDSDRGPAVFYRLGELTSGDEVVVRLSDGQRVLFVVDRVLTAPKAEFPSRDVYGPVPDAQLRLITCGGPYDRVAGSYQDNTVVLASAVATP